MTHTVSYMLFSVTREVRKSLEDKEKLLKEKPNQQKRGEVTHWQEDTTDRSKAEQQNWHTDDRSRHIS